MLQWGVGPSNGSEPPAYLVPVFVCTTKTLITFCFNISDASVEAEQWLSENVTPDSELQRKWEDTYELRMHNLRKEKFSVNAYLHRYPALRMQVGIKLVSAYRVFFGERNVQSNLTSTVRVLTSLIIRGCM